MRHRLELWQVSVACEGPGRIVGQPGWSNKYD
jgi:hypothetical protein